MLVWWFIGSFGYLLIGRIVGEENPPPLADLDPRQDQTVPIVDLSMNEESLHANSNETYPHPHYSANMAPSDSADLSTTTPLSPTTVVTQAPEPFSCYLCANCSAKADLVSQICEEGVTSCFKAHKRIDNTTRLIRRGCSTSKMHCIVPHGEQSNPFESVTCCNSHKCNEGTAVKPLLLLFKLGLFILLPSMFNA